ncbi:MAG: lipid-A-disaccharide synthase [Candidatus Omnitrophica bacterium]|nr:lipid-A-disaccharide synthase [Candidatus Omnitrophota bacterium]
MAKKIYVIAGEASGDLHGANLIQELKARSQEPLEIYGVGGNKIRETGALRFLDIAHFHSTGFTEAVQKIPAYYQAAMTILKNIKETRPDVVVLIDNPGFNLRLAKKIHALGFPIVYYIAPQLWAWAPNRILQMKRTVQKVLVVFEFEKKLFEERSIPVTWVGHPLKDMIERKHSCSTGPLAISLLPGSRKTEIHTLLPIFLKAAKIISQKLPHVSFFLIQSPTLPPETYDPYLRQDNIPLSLVSENRYDAVQKSRLAIACSGTATLECAILGTPLIILNKGSFLTYLAARTLIRIPYLGLPNILLGEKKFPELLQYDANPKKIAEEAMRLLTDEKAGESMRKDLERVSQKLGEKGASSRAAAEVLKMLK